MAARVVPEFPLLGEPGEWSELVLLAATVFLEADGEPDEGKLGVAYVCVNRRAWGLSLHQVILGPEAKAYGDSKPFETWSCWNDDYLPVATARLAAAMGERVTPCWRAASAVLWGLAPDPTMGANFYLNVELTKKIRKGTLPTWYDERKVTAVIGRHTFLKI